MEETLEALDRLVQDGKVLYIRVSNFEAWQVAMAMQAIAESNLARITVLQPRYNLLNRSYERDLLPLARASSIGVVPYNPLGAGLLTGKYKRGEEPPAESRFAQGDYGRMYQGRYLERPHVRRCRRGGGTRPGEWHACSACGGLAAGAAGRDCTHHRRLQARAAGGDDEGGGAESLRCDAAAAGPGLATISVVGGPQCVVVRLR